MGVVVVGAGISGCVIARLLAESGQKVQVLERAKHIGGKIYDKNIKDVNVHMYGTHIFNTNSSKVLRFIRRFTDFVPYTHEVQSFADDFYSVPINLRTLEQIQIRKEIDIDIPRLVQKYHFNNVIQLSDLNKKARKCISKLLVKPYFNKLYGEENVTKEIIKQVPVRLSYNTNYFNAAFQGIPKEGYTKLCENLLNHKNICLSLNSELERASYKKYDLFWTGSIDEFFEYEHGILPYRAMKFHFFETKGTYQKCAVIQYPSLDCKFHQTHEYKHLINQNSNISVCAHAIPMNFELMKTDRYIPLINEQSNQIYNEYLKMKEEYPYVHFLGRLGLFKNYNISQAIESVLDYFGYAET